MHSHLYLSLERIVRGGWRPELPPEAAGLGGSVAPPRRASDRPLRSISNYGLILAYMDCLFNKTWVYCKINPCTAKTMFISNYGFILT